MQDLFFSGHYQEVLAQSIDRAEPALKEQDLPYIIGALTFQGRLDEANHLYGKEGHRLCPVASVVARFYLGVGYCRQSNYEVARQYFGRNLRVGANNSNPLVQFYAWQGLGFYRLFFGRYQDGCRAARKALAAALDANFLYGKTLATDLMAHNQIVPGQISQALHSFGEARRYAKLLGAGGISQAVDVAEAIHSAQFGLNPEGDVGNLQRQLDSFDGQDNYSRPRLLLELARQYVLRGRTGQAWKVLDQVSRLIYSAKNRRYSIILNLRYAYLLYLQGDFYQGINLLKTAESLVDTLVDKSLAYEVGGLMSLILSQTAMNQPPPRELLVDERRRGKAIHQRIVNRKLGRYQTAAYMGDDPLGDLIDLCQVDPERAAAKIQDTGYFGLLHHIVKNSIGAKMLVFDLLPGSVAVFDRGSVSFSQNTSSVIRALARELHREEVSKEELIKRVWGYPYNPLRHDALIYRNISRFRSLLGDNGAWLQATAEGYRLLGDVVIRFNSVEKPYLRDALPAIVDSELNHRQLQILKYLEEHDYIDVKICSELYEVSEITARRDLSDLVKHDRLKRTGKGRAIRYHLA